MSERNETIREALSQVMSDLGDYDVTEGESTRRSTIVQERHPVRHIVHTPRPPALRTREGRFSPAGVCVFCNVARHEHGKVCGRDDYTEWQRVLKEESASDHQDDPTESFTQWRVRTGFRHEGDASKLIKLWRAEGLRS